MTKTAFDELHPRIVNGTFATKQQSAPLVTLTPDSSGWPSADEPITGPGVLASATADRTVTERQPFGISQTRAALRNLRGEPNDGIRSVYLSWSSVPAASNPGDIDVHGPKDGRPIIIDMHAGHPRIVVKTGYAIIKADSSAGNSIRVEPGAVATVIAGAGRKVSVTAERGSVVDFITAEKTRGLQVANGDAIFTVHGDVEGVSVSRYSER